MRRALLVALAALACAPAADADDWRATWGTGMSVMGAEDPTATLLQTYVRLTFPDLRAHDQTLRQIVRTSVGGGAVRVRLTNALGDGPLRVGHVTVRTPGGPRVDVPFDGRRDVTLPAGTERTSDPVDLAVDAEQQLAISIHVVESPPRMTLHLLSLTGSTATAPGTGDLAADPDDAAFTQGFRHWPYLAGVDVLAPRETGTVVAFGDSITDGAYVSNAFFESKDQSWPSRLAARLRAQPADRYARAVVNTAISGNTVVTPSAGWVGPPAVDRFDRDALDRPGVSHVVLFEGTNDLGAGTLAGEVQGALAALVRRAHARGVRVVGATLTPRSDTDAGWTAGKEAARRQVNSWIRTFPEYDGVIDLDRALADPADPSRMLPAYDSGDHLHPGVAGRQAIADAVDLSLLRCTPDPVASLRRSGVRLTRGRVVVRGAVSDGRCRSVPVDRVLVSVARVAADGRCRFLGTRGRLLPARPCADEVLLAARGRSRWRLSRRATLPRGRYRVTARARAEGDAGPVTAVTLRR